MVLMARPSPLGLVPPSNSRALETSIAMAPTSVPKSPIANELRYLGVRLMMAFIKLAFLLLSLLTFVSEALIEHGWPGYAFKWMIITEGSRLPAS
jgi:hypothetical protein